MKVMLLQTSPRFGAVDANLEEIRAALGDQQADLLVLPELCLSGYQMRDRHEARELAEPRDGPSIQALAELARDMGGAIVAGFAERAGARVFNSAALIDGEGCRAVYRKVHLFGREKDCFDPGDEPFQVHSLGPVRLGMMVCFDWIFPEAARSLALAGAQLIAHPANLVLPWCQEAMRTRALENRVFCLTANRVGREARLEDEELCFTGGSQVVGPDGRVLGRAGVDQGALLCFHISPEQALDKQLTPTNSLFADRRPGLYRLES